MDIKSRLEKLERTLNTEHSGPLTCWNDNSDGTFTELVPDGRTPRTLTRTELDQIEGTRLVVTHVSKQMVDELTSGA